MSLSSGSIRVLLFDTRENVFNVEVTSSTRKRQTTTVTITRQERERHRDLSGQLIIVSFCRTNITLFGTNDNTNTVLNSSDLIV